MAEDESTPPKRVPFGFNPRTETNQMELSDDRGPGSAMSERAGKYWPRTAYWRGPSVTGPHEIK